MCIKHCYIIMNLDSKKMPEIVLSYALTQSTMQPRFLDCLPLRTRSVPYTQNVLGAGEGSHNISCILNRLPKIDTVQLCSMAPEVSEHHSFLKFQLAVAFAYSHLLPCVYFIFMHMTAVTESACAISQLLFSEKRTWQLLDQQRNNSEQSLNINIICAELEEGSARGSKNLVKPKNLTIRRIKMKKVTWPWKQETGEKMRRLRI